MGLLIFGIILALAGIFSGNPIGFLFLAIPGGIMTVKGFRQYSADKEKKEQAQAQLNNERWAQQEELRLQREEKDRLDREEVFRKQEDENRIREIEQLKIQQFNSVGRQNLRRMVNELVDYSNQLKPEQDNSSTVSAMHDTVSRIAADELIGVSHKQDANIQHDLDGVMEHLRFVGLGEDRISTRIRHYVPKFAAT